MHEKYVLQSSLSLIKSDDYLKDKKQFNLNHI